MGLILMALSAALYSAANYKGELYILNWIFLIPFFYYLFKMKKRAKNFSRVAFISSWQLGFFILVFSANFLYHSIRLYTSLNPLLTVLLLALVFLILSLFYGVFILLYLYLVEKLDLKRKFNPYFFAVSWLIFEWGRYYLTPFFPLVNPAYSQAEFLNFIQLAEYGGIWLLTFILILVNGLLFEVFFERKYKKIVVLIVLFTLIFSNGSYQLSELDLDNQKKIKIGIITSQIKQQNKWKQGQISKNNEILFNAFNHFKKADLIIAPETNLTFDFYNNSYYRENLITIIKEISSSPVQVGALAAAKSEPGRFNSSFLISSEGEISGRYNKNLLLVFGEKFPQEKFLNKYTPFNFNSLKSGSNSGYFKSKNLKWKTVICSEILYPHYVRTRNQELDFIVNQTNEAWFADSILVKNTMWQAAVIRAVENRTAVIKTGNKSANGIIYSSGRYQKVESIREADYHLLELSSF